MCETLLIITNINGNVILHTPIHGKSTIMGEFLKNSNYVKVRASIVNAVILTISQVFCNQEEALD